MNLRRGLLRLALGSTALWFVFWTLAYVLHAPSSEMSESLPPALTPLTAIWLIGAAVLLLPWIAFGFRSS